MTIQTLWYLLRNNADTGIIIEELDGTCHCQLLVGYVPAFLLEKVYFRFIDHIYVRDNNLHVVLVEEKEDD